MNLSYKVRGQDIRLEPINQFEMDNGSIIAMYQGSRGMFYDLKCEIISRLNLPMVTPFIIFG